MAGAQSMVGASDEEKGTSVTGEDVDVNSIPKNLLKGFKEVKKYTEGILKDIKDANKEAGKIKVSEDSDKVGSGRIGLSPIKRAAGYAGMAVMAVGSAAMGMAPNTMAAVTQRLGADSYAGLSGMSSRRAILQANKQVGGGATSAMGPTMAQATLMYGGGYSASSVSSKNIMSQLGSMSALTGGTNEQVAASIAGANGMGFLRGGIRLRDDKGNLRPMNQLINEVYNFMFRGQKITKEQAALILNPGSKGYATLQTLTGGDANLQQALSAGILARASAGSASKFNKAMTSKDPNKILDVMGVDKSSPTRSNFNYQSSENRKLAATEQGLVGGYNTGLNATAALNNGFSSLAETLPGVTKALMTFKGILETMPNAGNMGATVSNGVSSAVGLGVSALQLKMLKGMMGKTGAASLANGGTGIVKGAGGLMSALSKGAKFLGKGVPVLGTALSAYGGYKDAKSKGGFDWGSVLKSAGIGAAGGAAVGAMGMGVGAGPGAIIGALLAGGGNALGQLFGMGGPTGNTMNMGVAGPKETALMSSPVPAASPVTSPWGPRRGSKTISRFHRGVDYGVRVGTPVESVGPGVVTFVGQGSGWGNNIVIKHPNGYSSRYAHLSSMQVGKGDKIRANQVIGKSGGKPGAPGAGNSTGPHLHFEILNKKGVQINPANIIGKKGYTEPFENFTSQVRRSSYGSSGSMEKFTSMSELSSSDLASILGSGFGAPLDFNSAQKMLGSRFKSMNTVTDKVSGDSGSMVGGGRKGLMQLLSKVGFTGKGLNTAFAVALAESGGRPNAHNDNHKTGDNSYGLFQINMLGTLQKERLSKHWKDAQGKTFKLSGNRDLFNPLTNAKVAYHMTAHGNNWAKWSTYKDGTFAKFLDDAERVKTGQGGGSSEMGMGVATAPPMRQAGSANVSANSNVTIKVDMNVNIAQASPAGAKAMLSAFKSDLERELRLKGLGTF